MVLHNCLNSKELKKRLAEEGFRRHTLSFYRYIRINDPQEFRDILYLEWKELNCLGRIYIAKEGINAQMSVPLDMLDEFMLKLKSHEYLKDIMVRFAIDDDGMSFYKLTIKIRPKIVADGLSDDEYDFTDVGTHLTAIEFHNLMDQPDALVVDFRNHYESEIGRFKGAICPDADTFREELEMAKEILKDKKDRKILLYCTGGIRCEKASAYLRHEGFTDVNQLHGGILEYARQIKKEGLESKFIGKNFVFDNRLGERITDEIISHCHQCGILCDSHINCANDDCHLLFIQCDDCHQSFNACCSEECRHISDLPSEERMKLRQVMKEKYSQSKIYKSHWKLPHFKNNN